MHSTVTKCRTELFVRQHLSEIGSWYHNILLVRTAWRQSLRKFGFLFVLNRKKINFSKCVKVKSLFLSKLFLICTFNISSYSLPF